MSRYHFTALQPDPETRSWDTARYRWSTRSYPTRAEADIAANALAVLVFDPVAETMPRIWTGRILFTRTPFGDNEFITDVVEGYLVHPHQPHLWPGPHSLGSVFDVPKELKMQEYAPDAPVRSEIHYRVLHNRKLRWTRSATPIIDTKTREDVRITRLPAIVRALHDWNANLPIAALQIYEMRIKRLKQLLRSTWKQGLDYATIQREYHFLRQRTTEIYDARRLARHERRTAEPCHAHPTPPSAGLDLPLLASKTLR